MGFLRRIGRLKNSEKMLLKELYIEYKPVLYKAVFKITRDAKIAEDIVHNVFIKVSDKLNEIEDPVELKKWMMTVAKNEAIDFYNHNKKTITSENIDEINNNCNNYNSPEDHMEKNEEKELINKYYNKLPDEDRDVIYYKMFEGLTYEEIGAKLDEKETTLRSRYKRALDKLRSMIGEKS